MGTLRNAIPPNSVRRIARALRVAFVVWVGFAGGVGNAFGEESDQYLSWGIELPDSADVLNEFINEKLALALKAANDAPGGPCSCDELVDLFFRQVYIDRLRDYIFEFIAADERIQLWPDRVLSVSAIKEKSIYRDVTLPYVIRMAATVRVGDVYLGTDKFAHLFGFGRRYYQRYLDNRRDGLDEDAAIAEIIDWGIFVENTVLGKGVTGIFSRADLESNYQGFLLARDLCAGEEPYVHLTKAGWERTRPIDLRDYVSPAFDESFYPSVFVEIIRGPILDILRTTYSEKVELESVHERFEGYGRPPVSVSMKRVERYLSENGFESPGTSVMDALGIDKNHPMAPFEPASN